MTEYTEDDCTCALLVSCEYHYPTKPTTEPEQPIMTEVEQKLRKALRDAIETGTGTEFSAEETKEIHRLMRLEATDSPQSKVLIDIETAEKAMAEIERVYRYPDHEGQVIAENSTYQALSTAIQRAKPG